MQILFTPEAELDLIDIWNYTAESWSVEQAATYVRAIKVACSATQLHQPAENIRPGYRKIIIKKHVVYVLATNGNVTVVRILHQSMDSTSELE